MEIRRCLIYVIINCVLITQLEAKTVSLNELLAKESKEKRERARQTKSTGSTEKTPLNKFIAEPKQTQEEAQRPKPSGSKGKTVSLNELIEIESKKNHNKVHRPQTSRSSLRRQPLSLKDLFTAETKHNRRKIDNLLSQNLGAGLLSHRKRLLPSIDFKNFESVETLFTRAKTLSPTYRKKFEIESPLNPKKLKHFFPRLRRRHSKKREIYENEHISNKYVPLIKRLGLLVDDILASGSGEFYEVSTRRPKRRPNQSKLSENKREPECKCDVQSGSRSAESKPHKKTVVPATTVHPEIATDAPDAPTEAPTTPADTTPTGNIYTVRPDPNLSLLFTRNSTSPRRDYYGFSERSGPALHRDVERNITRNNGNDEYNSRGRKQTCLQDDEENPCGSTRNYANGDGSFDWEYSHRTDSRHPHYAQETKETNKVASDDDRFFGGGVDETEEENKFKVGRNTEETIPVQGDIRRLRGFVPEREVNAYAQSVQPKETSEESIYSVPQDQYSPERLANRYGAPAAKNQKLRTTVETVKPINDILNPDLLLQNSQPNQVVTIFDGYSVARDINGRNKLTEKSIHITS